MHKVYIGESVEKDEFIERLLKQISEGVEETRKEYEKKMASDTHTLEDRYNYLQTNMLVMAKYCDLVYGLSSSK